MENFQKHFDTGRQILQSLISFLTDNCLTASPSSLFRWFTISVVLVSLWLAGRGKIFISWVIFACQIRGQKKNVKKKDCDKLSRLGRNKYKASSMPRLLFFVIKTCRVPYGNNFYVRSFPFLLRFILFFINARSYSCPGLSNFSLHHFFYDEFR